MPRSQRWREEWRWPQNVSWCCISYCLLSLFHAMVCMIMLKAIYIFELCFLSIFLMEGIKKRRKKKGLWLIVERTEAHYRETGWTLATHAIHLGSHGAHYPFGETTGQGATTCPLQLPQKHVPQNSKVTLDGTLLFSSQLSYLLVSRQAGRRWQEWDENRWHLTVTVSVGDWWW